MKKARILIFILFITFLMVSWGNGAAEKKETSELWKKVGQAEKNGLPKTAIKSLKQIYLLALRSERCGEALKAIVHQIALESIITGNKPQDKVNRLREEITKAPVQMKPLMKVVLTQWYWHYYSRNKWRFINRSRTQGLNEKDFTTWDLPKLFNEISSLFQDILKDEKKLKQIPVEDFMDFLEKGSLPTSLRPTLFDFIAFQALNFYTSAEQVAAQPEDAFVIEVESKALAPADEFLTWKLVSTDADSPKFLALKLYQKILFFHKQNHNQDAFVDADIHRLRYVRNVAVGENKSERYIKRQKELATRYPDSNLSSLARYYWASELVTRGELTEAILIARKGHEDYPFSRGGKNNSALIAKILRKEFQLKIEKTIPPDSPGQMVVSYKNIESLNFRIVRDNLDDYLKGNKGQNFNWLPQAIIQKMLEQKAVQQWSINLKPTTDYREKKTLVRIPPLKSGFYRIFASFKDDFSREKNKIQHSPIWISNIGLVSRGRENNLEGYVVNSRSGKVLKNTSISLYQYDYNLKGFQLKDSTKTDPLGYFSFSPITKYYHNRLIVVKTPDGDYFAESGTPNAYFYPDQPFQTTIFFTDRSLYRPGQMVHFKGLCLDVNRKTNDYKPIPRRRVKVYFKDKNSQEIASLDLMTSDFGSFSGTFVAPRDRLMGRMTLNTYSPPGSTSFRIEEYKRPKFQVNLSVPDKEYKLADEVEMAGTALAYTGAPIDNAQVTYRVIREVRFPSWWYFWYSRNQYGKPMEITHGKIRTDKNGKFTIKFIAKPDLKISKYSQPIFTFRVQADVTDSSGETRTASTQIRLGYTAIEAFLGSPSWQEEKKAVTITVTTSTLNGKRVGVKGILEVFKLKGPRTPVPADLIGEVKLFEEQARDKGELKGFANTQDWQKWPVQKKVVQKDFETSADPGKQCVVTFSLKKGVYRVRLKSADKFGNRVESFHYLMVNKIKSSTFFARIPYYFAVQKQSLEVGETFRAIWGTGYHEGPVLIEIFKDSHWVKRYWTIPENTQGLIKIPVTEKLKGGFTVATTFVKDNRYYHNTTRVYVPWIDKRLNMQWQTFRSKLQPGQKETWSLKIRGAKADIKAAEMVATLYDVSLDQYFPHYFPTISNIFSRDRTYLRSRYSNQGIGFMSLYDYLNPYVPYAYDNYLHFPRSVTQDLFGFEYGRRGIRQEIVVSETGVEVGVEGGVEGEITVSAAPPLVETRMKAKKGMVGGRNEVSGKVKEEAPAKREEKKPDLSKVQARKNLNETAFFYPHLLTDKDGVVTINFKMPEALTEWRFMGFAHTRDLDYGSIEGRTVTQKELMVQPNPPRFLREGDVLAFTIKVTNMQDTEAEGKLKLSFFNPLDNRPLDDKLNHQVKEKTFAIPAKQSRSFSFPISIPDNLGMLSFRAVGATKEFSDGEEGTLPVLSRRIFVQESIPLWISDKGIKKFWFKKLIQSKKSSTLKHRGLTVQMASNPAWYAVQALPFLMEFPYECSEQVFNRLYANGLARQIANSDPKIRRVFDLWKKSGALKSNLEKNQDLKSVLLQESPWVLQARNETQAKHRVGLLFDNNRMQSELKRAYLKLKNMQLNDGSWPWFPGGPGNQYITLYITTGFGRLKHLKVDDISQDLAHKALGYLDAWINKNYQEIVRRKIKHLNHLTATVALYLYGRSFFLKERPVPKSSQEAVNYFISQARTYWLKLGYRQSQAQLALALNRFGFAQTAQKIMRSMKERSQFDEELGRFWGELEFSWWWFRAPIETQAVMIEAFDEVMQDKKAVKECKIWLLKQKQTQDWKTTKATADAVYALILKGEDLLASDALVEVQLGGKTVKPEKVEAGTGFYEKRYPPADIVPEMGKITVKKVDRGIAWGGVHWQYMEDISKITPHTQNPLKLKKTLFVRHYTKKGPVIRPYTGKLQVGDLMMVRIELRVDRDMEYVHMKDHRGSGMEPVNVLSRYKYQDGLVYYESTKDTATHFFIDYLPKGTYVFEYPLRVVHKGSYQNGMAHIECMYAPEFNSHSESTKLEVE